MLVLAQAVEGMTPTDDEAVKKREKMLKDAAEKATELAERAKREKIEAVREAASHKQMFDKAEARMNEFKQMYEALEATHKGVSKALAEMTKKVSETQKQEGTDDASKSAVHAALLHPRRGSARRRAGSRRVSHHVAPPHL